MDITQFFDPVHHDLLMNRIAQGIRDKRVLRLIGNQSRTSEQLRDTWRAYIRGWWNYYQLTEDRRNIFGLEGWIRRHIRQCFWLRWHSVKGRLKALRRLGLRRRQLKVAHSSRGAWPIAASPSLHTALRNARLRAHGFLMPSDLAAPE